MIQFKNKVNEKKAQLKTLEGLDKPDMAAINKSIDEVTTLRAEMMKSQAAFHQDIRKLLNDEQKIEFNHLIRADDFGFFDDCS